MIRVIFFFEKTRKKRKKTFAITFNKTIAVGSSGSW